MGSKMTESERLDLFNKWYKLTEEIMSISQANYILVRMRHPKASIVEPILDEAQAMKQYEADSLKRELDSDIRGNG